MTMPPNRPFLYNFLSAFRAHSTFQPTTTPSVTTTVSAQSSQFGTLSPPSTSPTSSTSPATAAPAPRSIATKQPTTSSNPTTTVAAVQAASSHLSRPSPTCTPASPTSRTPSIPFASSNSARQRRESDSSSEGGFRDALGTEKWYIGGRTPGGEERFYRLGMIRRERSGDRLSLDRLSL